MNNKLVYIVGFGSLKEHYELNGRMINDDNGHSFRVRGFLHPEHGIRETIEGYRHKEREINEEGLNAIFSTTDILVNICFKGYQIVAEAEKPIYNGKRILITGPITEIVRFNF